jgi:3-oxoadipate enol-lactonase
VVGHSWAGGVGVLLAQRYPDLVHSLVLVGAACTPDSIDGVDHLLALPIVGEALTVAGLVALGEVLPKVRRLSPRIPLNHRDRFLASLPDQSVLGGERGALGRHRRTFVTEQRALIDEIADVHAALPWIRVPTAVVVGSWDLVVRPDAGRTLASLVAGAELVEIPRAGHFVARDSPDELAGIVARYGHDAPILR